MDSAAVYITGCIEMGSIDKNYTLPYQSISSVEHANAYTLPVQNNFMDILTMADDEEKAFPTLFPSGKKWFYS